MAVVLSELYVIILSKQKTKIFGPHPETIELISKLILLTSTSHQHWPRRIRIAILTITVSCIRHLKEELKQDPESAIKMFNPICRVACEQLTLIENARKGKEQSDYSPHESILKINLLNEILKVCEPMPDLNRNCVHMKLCLRLVQCLASIVQTKSERPITISILDCLMHLVQTDYAEEFLLCDFSLQLWVKFLPPKEIVKRDPFNEVSVANLEK